MLFVVGELGIRFKALCGGVRATKYASIPTALTSAQLARFWRDA
jgi:hypothetical protein